jgi:hypothetical protein
MSRWLLWMPALMVGALFYWTVALGLGGLSLVAVSALSSVDGAPADPVSPEDTAGPSGAAASDEDAIVVHLQAAGPGEAESADVVADSDPDDVDDAVDVNDNAGAASSSPSSIEVTAVEPAPGR